MRGVDKYKSSKVETADNVHVVMMLFQEANKRMERAATIFEEDGRRLNALEEIAHTRTILLELQTALDHEQGGELSEQLYALYSWSLRELHEAGNENSAERIRGVQKALMPVIEGWSQMVNNRATGKG